MNSLPKISIVTPSFNQGEFLEECIDSILSQNYPNLEYIIMDGGSTDGSVEIIKKYEKHLTYWQSQPDGGQYNAVNDGFKRTTGEIMAWLNSDDKYHRDAFFKVALLFESSPGVEWLTGHPTFWGKSGEFIHMEPVLPTYCRKDFLEGRYNQPFIQQESTFWKRSLWNRAGNCLRTDLGYAGDLELWVRFFRHALLYSVDTFLGGYRSHGNQKAALCMDQYVAEAETVINAEKANQGDRYVQMSPDAPAPLVMNMRNYMGHLHGTDLAGSSASLMGAAEDVLQYFLNGAGSASACAEERQRLLAAFETVNGYANIIQSSLSWRITKPLRRLGDFLRKL